jgi:hypothetical protein
LDWSRVEFEAHLKDDGFNLKSKIQFFMSHEIAPITSQNPSDPPDEASSIEKRILDVRSRISDLGFEIDAEKAGLGLAMGAGVFSILLGVLAGYDLLTGKAGIWSSVGITQDTLQWIAYGCGGVGAALIAQALARRLRRDRNRETELADLEQEYAQLLDRKNSLSQD